MVKMQAPDTILDIVGSLSPSLFSRSFSAGLGGDGLISVGLGSCLVSDECPSLPLAVFGALAGARVVVVEFHRMSLGGVIVVEGPVFYRLCLSSSRLPIFGTILLSPDLLRRLDIDCPPAERFVVVLRIRDVYLPRTDPTRSDILLKMASIRVRTADASLRIR
ncbi:hypothetical protein EAS54_38985 [Bradyrhizobium guangzhouense]|nr:hypothetical protein EAS54_38985 [Bradyrhizobium guangzhouense]